MIHRVKGFGTVNKAEVDVFLELSCFFDVPKDVGNLISGSSDLSKASLSIWKFLVHILLRPSLENFEYYLASVKETISKMKRQPTQLERIFANDATDRGLTSKI